KGRGFSPSAVANDRCTSCHRDGAVSNGKILHTPHGGTLGYPVANGNWTWTGVTQSQWVNKKLSGKASDFSPKDQFHLIHIAGNADQRGQTKCGDCHTAGFDPSNIKTGVQDSCAQCHTVNYKVSSSNSAVAGCIGCHAQHGEQKEFKASTRQDVATQTNAEPPSPPK